MLNYKLLQALCFTIISFGALADDIGKEGREIQMADQAVFWSIIAGASKQARAECSRNILSCSDDRGDLGLALLAEKRSLISREALVSLVSYKLDAGLSEGFNCYILEKGQAAIGDLKRVESKKLRESCERKLAKAMLAAPGLLHNVHGDDVCSTEEVVREKIETLMRSIKLNKKCAGEDF